MYVNKHTTVLAKGPKMFVRALRENQSSTDAILREKKGLLYF